MLEILKEKLFSWTQEKADMFHNNLVRDERAGKYVWEHTDDGIFLYRNGSSHFMKFNGLIYKLTDQYHMHDFEMHLRFMDECTKKNIRVDVPITHEFIDLETRHYNVVTPKLLYSVVRRPNSELGEDYFTDVLESKVTTDYLLEYIEQTESVLNVIRNLMPVSNNLAPACRFTVFHRNRDSVGYFWKDIKKWRMPYTEFLNYHFSDLSTVVDYLKLHNIDIDDHKIKEYAGKAWAQN